MGLIDDKQLMDWVDKEGVSQAEAARRFGVTRQSVSKRLKKLREGTTVALSTRRASPTVKKIINHKLDTLGQLGKINKYANELLDVLMRWHRGDEEALEILESMIKEKKIRVAGEFQWVKELTMKDPRELALKAMAEIRNQLKLQFDMFQTIYSIQAAEEFQEAVLEEIGKAAPDVRDAIIRRLTRRRAVREAIRVDRSKIRS